MFGTPSRYAPPGARYRAIDVAARVEGATPHGLVVIMFEELLKGLDVMLAPEAARDAARRNAAQARVISLLHGLDSALDYKRGGEIAENLGRIYREARRLLTAAPGPDRHSAIQQARHMLETVSGAWDAIDGVVNSKETNEFNDSERP